MMPSYPGRHHEYKNDACRTRGTGKRYPRPVCSGPVKDKRRTLDESIAATGYHEKSAIRVLNSALAPKRRQDRQLIRVAPSLCLASVLRLSRDRRLSRSLRIEVTGSHFRTKARIKLSRVQARRQVESKQVAFHSDPRLTTPTKF